jgi:hypothetical protein
MRSWLMGKITGSTLRRCRCRVIAGGRLPERRPWPLSWAPRSVASILSAVAKPRAVRRDPESLFATRKPPKKLPFDFVLAELEELGPVTRPMFGCHAVYVDDKIVFILRQTGDRCDDGVWVATTMEHHAALRRDLPSLRSITVLAGGGVTGWQVLPAESDDFEASALLACELVKKRDVRIGKVPGARRGRRS